LLIFEGIRQAQRRCALHGGKT